ncbi:MAG: TMEM175 family protein [Enterococcus sp.]
MKERVVVFGDAVIAIILTIIVLELPINYLGNGTIDLSALFRVIGIYFISFCFVADLWFQTAYAFNRIEHVRNKDLVAYMFLLFFLSLVPSATRILIEDTIQQTVLIYGILTLLVTTLMRRLIFSLMNQASPDSRLPQKRRDELNRQDAFNFFARIVLLIVGLFYTRIALVFYLVFPIVSFLQNIVDREENHFVDTLNQEEQAQYFQERNQLWGNSVNRYSKLLRESLRDTDTGDAEQWKQIVNHWKKQIEHEISERQQKLTAGVTLTDREKVQLQREIQQFKNQKERLNERGANFGDPHQRKPRVNGRKSKKPRE